MWNLCDSMLTAIPSFGLFVNRNLTFHIFLSGLPLPTSHSLYDFKLYDNDAIFINILLAAIENFKLCEGFTESGNNVTIPVLYKASQFISYRITNKVNLNKKLAAAIFN